jgi:hypothetical protein
MSQSKKNSKKEIHVRIGQIMLRAIEREQMDWMKGRVREQVV